MDRSARQAWLKDLAAEDRRRREAAEPELERKEAFLNAARRRLAASEAAIADIEVAIEDARRDADEPDSG
jgi:hypothetical protein